MSENFPIPIFSILLLAIFSVNANAITYHVGSSGEYTTIQSVISLVVPGDIVLVDGDATYSSEVTLTNSGTKIAPITIQGVKINGKRPLLAGGTGQYGFNVTADYYIIDGFESAGYHGLELIGFDPPDNLKANASTLREDGDVVGNVIIASALPYRQNLLKKDLLMERLMLVLMNLGRI